MHLPRSTAWSWLMRPRTRAWLLAGFLAVHLALTVPLAILAVGWDWPESGSWFRQLNLDGEGTAANLYSGILWGAFAALAGTQLFRPVPSARGPRWLWVLGWLSAVLLAALVAFEELADLKDTLGRWEAFNAFLASVDLADLPISVRWLAIVGPLGVPLAAAAAWVVFVSVRRHPALALLTVLAVALGMGAALRDGFGELYGTTAAWALFIEDGSEIMAAAILVVVLIELRAGTKREASTDQPRPRGRAGRWAALVAAAALLAASIPALLADYEWEEEGIARPLLYAGPISLLEQSFRSNLDQLTRIQVWSYVRSSGGNILARLTPAHSGSPVAARARVPNTWPHPVVVDLNFEPIPDSQGKWYTLTILSDTSSNVHLGVTRGGMNHAGEAVVNGMPEPNTYALAMGTHAIVSGGRVIQDLFTRDPRRLFVIGDVVATVFLWVFAVVATWRGLSGPKPRFWRGFVWSAAQRSLLVTTGFAPVAIVLLRVLSATPHA